MTGWMALGFVAGAVGVYALPMLPSLIWLIALLSVTLMLAFISRLYLARQLNAFKVLLVFSAVSTGALWTSYYWQVCHPFPDPRLYEQRLDLQVVVLDLPESSSYGQRVWAKVVVASLSRPAVLASQDHSSPDLSAELSALTSSRALLYLPSELSSPVAAGQTWLLHQVKIKPLHGNASPGVFDFERWAYAHGLSFTGTTRDKGRLLGQEAGWQAWRNEFAEHWRAMLPDTSGSAIIRALLMADRRGLSDDDWSLLQQTGLAHLVAVSGLHIGLAFLLGGLLGQGVGRSLQRLGLLYSRWPLVYMTGLAVAAAYATLAGWGLPAQRAFFMLVVWVCGGWRAIPVSGWLRLLYALTGIILLWPGAPMGADFWLSSIAVATLLWLLQPVRPQHKFWQQWLGVQLALSFLMLPMVMANFAILSFASPLLNLLIVPVVSALLVPPLLLLAVASLASLHWVEKAAGYLSDVLTTLWLLLKNLFDAYPLYLPWHLGDVSMLGPGVAMVASIWLLGAKALPGKRWVWLAWLPLVFPQYEQLGEGEWRLVALDVGQGTAVVLQTKHHTLLYDTGPAYGDFVVAPRVIEPYLQGAGLEPDRILVSHDDRDHSGGAVYLHALYPAAQWTVGQLQSVDWQAEQCVDKTWQWDGVTFRQLQLPVVAQRDDNSASCVLHVQGAYHSALLLGDLDQRAEQRLMELTNNELQASLLVASHHGSRTGSSESMLDVTRPVAAIFTAGYRNHFGHPHVETLRRFQSRAIATYNTGVDGSVTADSRADKPLRITGYRETDGRLWWQWAPR
ncbi:DNA internalization-related competence protein ComEC/Rec2 [Pokkaliibacter plantistimulans]|nr:DNA internalization-related competence protein ComEC/Rec2 [Pokkaliibacter plantistimulans]